MITVVGIGPGDTNLVINEAKQVLSTAEIVYGSTRQLQEITELTTATPISFCQKTSRFEKHPASKQKRGYSSFRRSTIIWDWQLGAGKFFRRCPDCSGN